MSDSSCTFSASAWNQPILQRVLDLFSEKWNLETTIWGASVLIAPEGDQPSWFASDSSSFNAEKAASWEISWDSLSP